MEQINNRLAEVENIFTKKETEYVNNCCPMFIRHISDSYFIYKKLKFNKIYSVNNNYKMVCVAFRYLKDFYAKPIKSSKLGIYFASGKSSQAIFNITDISYKCIAIAYKTGFYVSPVIHQKQA